MPISTMLNFESRRPSSPASTRTCPAISPARQVAHQPHLAGQAEAALHRAADLRGNAERLARRVGNEDRLDAPAVVESEQKLHRAVGRRLAGDDGRRGDAEVFGQIGAQRPRQIRHLLEVGRRPWRRSTRRSGAREIAGARAPRGRPRALRDPSIRRSGRPSAAKLFRTLGIWPSDISIVLVLRSL